MSGVRCARLPRLSGVRSGHGIKAVDFPVAQILDLLMPIIFVIGQTGETSVENMVLLCSSHHKLVHEGGYSVQRDQTGELFFRRPDGKAVPYSGYHLVDQVDDDTLLNGPDVDRPLPIT